MRLALIFAAALAATGVAAAPDASVLHSRELYWGRCVGQCSPIEADVQTISSSCNGDNVQGCQELCGKIDDFETCYICLAANGVEGAEVMTNLTLALQAGCPQAAAPASNASSAAPTPSTPAPTVPIAEVNSALSLASSQIASQSAEILQESKKAAVGGGALPAVPAPGAVVSLVAVVGAIIGGAALVL